MHSKGGCYSSRILFKIVDTWSGQLTQKEFVPCICNLAQSTLWEDLPVKDYKIIHNLIFYMLWKNSEGCTLGSGKAISTISGLWPM